MSGAAFKVIRPGIMTTVQDLGRKGSMAWGVPESGAADEASLRVANLLCGNDEGDAALEITLGGFEAEFLDDTFFVVSGAPSAVSIGEREVPMNASQFGSKGATLLIGAPRVGVRAYLAVRGGIDVHLVLGSRATYAKAGLGGLEGRAIRKGDVISSADADGEPRARRLGEGVTIPSLLRQDDGTCSLRVIRGTMDSKFAEGAIDSMTKSAFTVSQDCDRMGIRLIGPKVAHNDGADIISSGLEPGAVQVPGSGQPIILMSDRQTTGGYTKAFSVISADRPKLGQLRPGDRVTFSFIGVDEAARELKLMDSVILEGIEGSGPSKVRTFALRINGSDYVAEVEEVT